MFFHPFTKLLLYRYSETLRLDLTGLAEWKLLASQCDMDDENMPGMVQWQLDVRALLRKQVIDELEAEVNNGRPLLTNRYISCHELDYLKALDVIKSRRSRERDEACEMLTIRQHLLKRSPPILQPTEEDMKKYKYVEVLDDDPTLA
ncbi:hypothetical protein BT96DRAFT_1008712 [Gymnopus androsaceus JB14]|uniref:Uncharacterized protein n=1 Tax=Gymnopus androsaceus JB14 TaxID=1447944 RepID=A0A6A4GEH8_9AGAR|nr:hypothetical protein BT96DRAFT_1008712 [Gymnopus androsaceus JB14]